MEINKILIADIFETPLILHQVGKPFCEKSYGLVGRRPAQT